MTRLKISPSFAGDNQAHIGERDAKFLGYLFVSFFGRCLLTNGAHVIDGQFRLMVRFAVISMMASAAFLYAILDIVGLGAEKQMPRITTRGIVALVQNTVAGWNLPVMQFIGNSMCKAGARFSNMLAITAWITRCGPFPAIIRATLVYFGPKQFSERSGLSQATIVPGDEPLRLPFDEMFIGATLRCNRGLLATTAVAITRLNFVKRQLGLEGTWGMLLHVFSASNATDQAWDVSRRRQALCIGAYSFIIAQVSA